MFAVTWGLRDVANIAATFSIGMSTFTGQSVVRVHISSHGSLAGLPHLKSAIANILAAGRAQVSGRGWIDKTLDPLSRMYIHALGETEIRGLLKEVGAQDGLIGEHLMYPLVMKFANIPPAMAMNLAHATPFVATPRRRPPVTIQAQ